MWTQENKESVTVADQAIIATNEIFNNLMRNFQDEGKDKSYVRGIFHQQTDNYYHAGCTVVIDVQIEEAENKAHIKTVFGNAK